MSAELEWIGIGFEDGTGVMARRDGEQIFANIVDKQNTLGQGTSRRYYRVDPSTGCYDLNQFVEGSEAEYDPTLRPWYTSTKESGRAGWGSGVYVDFSLGTLILSATAPLYAVDGTTLLGVSQGRTCYMVGLSCVCCR